MGRSGTEIVKVSADLVLIDDNIASLPYAIEEGHTFLANLKKSCLIGLADTRAYVLSFVFLEVPTPLENMSMMIIALSLDFCRPWPSFYSRPDKDSMRQGPRKVSSNHLINQRSD